MNTIEQIDTKYLNQDYENPKYIFHGDKQLVDVLITNKSTDNFGKAMNEQEAVYGSSIFTGAIPYAIKGKGKYDCEIGYRPDNLKMKIFYGVIPEDDYGYIYVCDAIDFVRCEDTCQFVSYTEVKPIEIIKVYYRDFKECFEYVDEQQKDNTK